MKPSLLILIASSLVIPLQAQELKMLVPAELTTIRTEGPVADKHGNIYFCNMAKEGIEFSWKSSNQGTIGIIKPDGTHEIFTVLPEGRRGNGMRFHPNGNLIIADQLGKSILELNIETKELTVRHQFSEEMKNGSPNDIAISKNGTIYISCWKSFWRILPDGTAEKVANGFHNGITLSPDEKTLYSANVFYSIGEDNSMTKISGKKLQAAPDFKGRRGAFTDGMRSDAEGNLYMAQFGGVIVGSDGKKTKQKACIHIFSPEGKFIRSVTLPGSKCTNLTFGGKHGKNVYITAPEEGIFMFSNDTPGREFLSAK